VTSRSWSREELQSVIEVHIANVVGHYKGKCYHWDVVNEAADDNGGWRSSVFYNTLGTDFLPISFNAAKAADPDAGLWYNDYNLEYNEGKTDRALEIVQIIQDAGAPIDGVGFQGHLIVGTTPTREQLADTLRRFTALGVDVAYTELDIRHSSMPPNDQALATQGDDYANVVGSCLDVEGCVGVTVWGYTDKYSWVPGTFPGTGAALLWDANFNKKPAYTSVSSVLAAAATAAP
jgi:endo-1,4-beta-xylanase